MLGTKRAADYDARSVELDDDIEHVVAHLDERAARAIDDYG